MCQKILIALFWLISAIMWFRSTRVTLNKEYITPSEDQSKNIVNLNFCDAIKLSFNKNSEPKELVESLRLSTALNTVAALSAAIASLLSIVELLYN